MVAKWALVLRGAGTALLLALCFGGSGLEGLQLCILGFSFAIICLGAKLHRRSGGRGVVLRTGSFFKTDFLRSRDLRHGCCHLASALVVLGTLLYALLAVRLAPDLYALKDAAQLEARLLEAFPEEVELLFSGGRLQVSPPGRGLSLRMPHYFLDLCGGTLMDALMNLGGYGVSDLQPATTLISSFFDAAEWQDSYIQVFEFVKGDRVEVLETKKLLACGLPRRARPAAVNGRWLPAVVEEARPHSRLAQFQYALRVFDEGDAERAELEAEAIREEVVGVSAALVTNCSVKATSVRQPEFLVRISGASGNVSTIDRLESMTLRPLLVFEELRFGVLQGFSFHHRQHWQYSNSPQERGPKLWRRYSPADLESFVPLSCATSIYCQEEPKKASTLADPVQIRCSRDVARDRIAAFRGRLPIAARLLLLSGLHLPMFFLLLWIVVVVSTLCCRILAVVLLYTPAAYVTCCLLRHVDTPVMPFCHVLGLTLITSLPALSLHRLCVAVMEAWGEDGHLHPMLHFLVDWEKRHQFHITVLWAIWNAYLVIRMREVNNAKEHAEKVAQVRSQRVEDELSADTIAALQVSNYGAHPPETEEVVPEMKDPSQPVEKEHIPAAAQGGAISANGSTEDEASEPVCRICYGGRETGRLISPCLCTGTMGLVHLDCLNMWRGASANPKSFYQCDQCGYRYSFQRALYATLLRSALVLHCIMILAFGSTVVFCSFCVLCVDRHYGWEIQANFTNQIAQHFDNFLNETEADPEVLRHQLNAMDAFQWYGMKLTHFVIGFGIVGISGFISIGFFWFPMYGREHHAGMEGSVFIFIVVITGTVRVMLGMYQFFKWASARLLQSAENMILEVGPGVDARFPPKPALLPPPEDAGKGAEVANARLPAPDTPAARAVPSSGTEQKDNVEEVVVNTVLPPATPGVSIGSGSACQETDGEAPHQELSAPKSDLARGNEAPTHDRAPVGDPVPCGAGAVEEAAAFDNAGLAAGHLPQEA